MVLFDGRRIIVIGGQCHLEGPTGIVLRDAGPTGPALADVDGA